MLSSQLTYDHGQVLVATVLLPVATAAVEMGTVPRPLRLSMCLCRAFSSSKVRCFKLNCRAFWNSGDVYQGDVQATGD